MPHVGVQRLRTGERQHDGADRSKNIPAAGHEEMPAVQRVERRQDGRLPRDVDDSADGQGAKPQDHDRAEDLAHGIRAVALQHEQPDQHRHRHRNDIGLQLGRDDLEALHRTEHRDRRRDHAVTVKQGGTGHTEQQQRSAQRRPVGDRLRCQCGEREDAAFAVVVGTQDQDHVLQRHHQHQGPEDDRNDADDADGVQRHRVGRRKNGAHGVQRAGADISVNHPQGGQRRGRQALLRGRHRRRHGACVRGGTVG